MLFRDLRTFLALLEGSDKTLRASKSHFHTFHCQVLHDFEKVQIKAFGVLCVVGV